MYSIGREPSAWYSVLEDLLEQIMAFTLLKIFQVQVPSVSDAFIFINFCVQFTNSESSHNL